MTQVDIHTPKVEHFDLTERTNTDPKGLVRAVDVYRAEPWGLYMARPTPGHPKFHYIQSWLLPTLGLRATIFSFFPGHELDQDFYLDVGEFGPVGANTTQWKSVDHYLDISVRTGIGATLLDVDELLAAHTAGLIDATDAGRAITHATDAVAGLAHHGYDLHRWLTSLGIALTWSG